MSCARASGARWRTATSSAPPPRGTSSGSAGTTCRCCSPIVTGHIPALLADPLAAGKQQQGDVAYRLAYQVEGALVTFVAVGAHDEAYTRAARGR